MFQKNRLSTIASETNLLVYSGRRHVLLLSDIVNINSHFQSLSAVTKTLISWIWRLGFTISNQSLTAWKEWIWIILAWEYNVTNSNRQFQCGSRYRWSCQANVLCMWKTEKFHNTKLNSVVLNIIFFIQILSHKRNQAPTPTLQPTRVCLNSSRKLYFAPKWRPMWTVSELLFKIFNR